MVAELTKQMAISPQGLERLADIILMMQRCFMLRLSAELSGGGVSFPQFFLLGHINSNSPMSMSEIASKMNHTTAAATGLVDRLENLRYVRRTTSPEDRRKVLVEITPKGVQLVDRIRQDMINNLSDVIATLSPQEQKMWLQIYEKIFAYCEDHKKTDP